MYVCISLYIYIYNVIYRPLSTRPPHNGKSCGQEGGLSMEALGMTGTAVETSRSTRSFSTVGYTYLCSSPCIVINVYIMIMI